MNLLNQLEDINKSIKQSYCKHDYLLQIDDPMVKHLDMKFIEQYVNPVRCFDCGKIVECDHAETELEGNNLFCLCCGKELEKDY
jgi:hypothetical protein